MSKRLLALNLLLVAASVALSLHLVRILSAPRSLPPPTVSSAAPPGSLITDRPAPSRPGLHAYEVVARRNLFDPNRSEGLVAPAASGVPHAGPFLYGVVINGTVRLAYLQDPVTKRIFGYRIGDTVAGGQLQEIKNDRVVIKRPEGPLEVWLKDPGKPKSVVSEKKPRPPRRPASPRVRRPRVRPQQGRAGPPAATPPRQ